MNALIFSAVFSTAGLCLGCDSPNEVQLLNQVQVSNTAPQDQIPDPVSETVILSRGIEPTQNSDSSNTSPKVMICDLSPIMNPKTYAYVLAPGGLYLRAHNNLHSERLTLMPWGAKVLVEQMPEINTMTVSGIPGTMYRVCFKDLQGYAFSGYLGPYAPPGHKMNAAEYTAHLLEMQEGAADSSDIPQYTRTVSDDLTAPSVSESLLMPGMNLNQAYLVAQRLFGIPEDLKCPSVEGPENAIYPDKKPKKGIWKSELAVRRGQGQIQEMTYVYRSKNFMRRVHLAPRENGVLIQAHETNIL